MPGSRSVLLPAMWLSGSRLHQETIVRRAPDSNVVINSLSAAGVGLLYYGFKMLGAAPEASYLIGFVPENPENGRYHKLRVRIAGPDSYSVQARPGYYAPEREAAGRHAPESPIDRKVSTRDVLTGVPATLAVLPDRMWRTSTLRAAVSHRQEPARPKARLDRRPARRGGHVVTGKKSVIELSLKEPSYEMLSREGINAAFVLEAGPGRYWLGSVVEESVSGKMSAAPLAPVVIAEEN
jgi:hypothetical protein